MDSFSISRYTIYILCIISCDQSSFLNAAKSGPVIDSPLKILTSSSLPRVLSPPTSSPGISSPSDDISSSSTPSNQPENVIETIDMSSEEGGDQASVLGMLSILFSLKESFILIRREREERKRSSSFPSSS